MNLADLRVQPMCVEVGLPTSGTGALGGHFTAIHSIENPDYVIKSQQVGLCLITTITKICTCIKQSVWRTTILPSHINVINLK